MAIEDVEIKIKHMMRAYQSPKHTVTAMFVQDGNTRFFGAGTPSDVAFQDQLFEIGSITKVFTGILYSVLVENGTVDPSAPLRDISDDWRDVPDRMTLDKLVSHSSGLPRIHVPVWKAIVKPLPKDPYAEFSRTDLNMWLAEWSKRKAPSKQRHSYSNLGFGLLGEALASSSNVPFVDLLFDKVIRPMGLRDTVVELSPDQQQRFAIPKNVQGTPVPRWTFKAIAGAGCLRSSARDMGRFSQCVLQALSTPKTPLDYAIARSAQPIFGLGPNGRVEPAAQCAGWLKMTPSKPAAPMLFHDGGTAGSTTALYVCPQKSAAISILSNNGIAANLWAGIKLGWSGQIGQAHKVFETL